MQDIHDNVIYIKGAVTKLEENIEKLADSVNSFASVIAAASDSQQRQFTISNESNQKIIAHIQNSLPIKIVVLLCCIICVAFLGGGILKEILDSHVISKILIP